jgi:hypothetical protein
MLCPAPHPDPGQYAAAAPGPNLAGATEQALGHPFLRLRDGTHPLALGSVNPGLLHRPGRSDRQRRCVPEAGPGRQIDLKTAERHRPIRRSGRDPGLRPYARTRPKPRKQGRRHYPHPPCRIGRRFVVCRTRGADASADCRCLRAGTFTRPVGACGPGPTGAVMSARFLRARSRLFDDHGWRWAWLAEATKGSAEVRPLMHHSRAGG